MAKFKLRKAYAKFCDKVSMADFLVIAAEAVMGRTATDYDAANPYKEGTMARKFRDGFKFGRETNEHC